MTSPFKENSLFQLYFLKLLNSPLVFPCFVRPLDDNFADGMTLLLALVLVGVIARVVLGRVAWVRPVKGGERVVAGIAAIIIHALATVLGHPHVAFIVDSPPHVAVASVMHAVVRVRELVVPVSDHHPVVLALRHQLLAAVGTRHNVSDAFLYLPDDDKKLTSTSPVRRRVQGLRAWCSNHSLCPVRLGQDSGSSSSPRNPYQSLFVSSLFSASVMKPFVLHHQENHSIAFGH